MQEEIKLNLLRRYFVMELHEICIQTQIKK